MSRSWRVILVTLTGILLLGPVLPSATGSPSKPSGTPVWLETVNAYRALGGLPPVTEEPSWSDGGVKHSRYMVKTGDVTHDEDPSSTWYTPEGAEAGANGNVAGSFSTAYTDVDAIEDWLTGPFHGVGILDPQLARSGFGSYRDPGAPGLAAAATLDVLRGLDGPAATSPVLWPGDGTLFPLRSYEGGEFPDPLTSCPQYSEPSGPPLYLLLTTTPSVQESSFSRDGSPLDHCVFDGSDYDNPDSAAEDLGRNILSSRNAVVLMPRSKLLSGATYDVSITSGGQVFAWSFTVQGPSEVARTVTFDLTIQSKLIARGTVADEEPDIDCEASVPVKLQRNKGNGWRNVASDTTSATGKYRMVAPVKSGDYRTKATPASVGEVRCSKATSSSIWTVG